MPSIIFDKKVIRKANSRADNGPIRNPAIIIIAVTGWTFGMVDRASLPTMPRAANKASKVIL